MKLNCRPGDLARFATRGPLQDKIIRVTVLDQHPGCDEPMWLYAGERIPVGYRPGTYVSFRDSHLRPIRPQPDDAVDESTAWLPPVPSREGITA